MIIQGKRIKTLNRHFKSVQPGTKLYLAVTDLKNHEARLKACGFTDALDSGESVLPPSSIGVVCHRNAHGWEIVHKDRPKETAYRMVEWHWKQFHGRYDTVDRSKFVNVPYKRYPRTQVPPPGVELSVATTTSGKKVIVIGPLAFNQAQERHIVHCANLMLEIFGFCEVLSEGLNNIIRAPIKHLNWQVLPPGQLPWPKLQPLLAPIVARAPQGNHVLINNRLQTISGFNQDFVAIGRAGFSGYVIFGFPNKKLFVLESAYYGNATYVFGDNWKRLSQLTKAEVLSQNAQQDRIVHLVGWHAKIKKLLS